MDLIDRSAAIAGATELRSALAHLEAARHRIEMAFAGSDECAMLEVIPPLATIMTCVSIKIASVEAKANGTGKPFPVLRVVEGGKR